jgi:hypothetical protein
MINRKSQSWTLEFILAMLIFVTATVASVRMITSIYSGDEFQRIIIVSEAISENLLSTGYPEEWDNNSVIRIGLLTDNILNITKLKALYDIDYQESKRLLNTKYNYFFYFSQNNNTISILEINTTKICGYGSQEISSQYANNSCIIIMNESQYKNIAKTVRLLVYNHSIIHLTVYVWNR